MELREYDGKCVRIADRFGDVFEGVCSYNGAEYSEHEFGRCEESLEIESFLFFRSDIERIESLEWRNGPYGRFSAPFGRLEEMTAEDGVDSICDALFSEEPEHVRRMLAFLLQKNEPPRGREGYDELIDAIRTLSDDAEDASVRNDAELLLKKWKCKR